MPRVWFRLLSERETDLALCLNNSAGRGSQGSWRDRNLLALSQRERQRLCPVAAKTKSPSSAPVVRRPRSKLTGRNPRPVTPAELGLPCGTSPEIVAAAVAGLEAGAAEPPQSYDQQSAISPREYSRPQRAYDFFGPGLFGLALPDVFFTYTPRSHSGGHYAHQRYAIRADGSKRSGLALNPDAFIGRDDRWIASVFVHEMAHVWQFAHGKPSGSYHNMQWAEKMESIGLMPSNTERRRRQAHRRENVPLHHQRRAVRPAFDELEATGWRLEMEFAAPFRPDAQKKRESKSKFCCEEACQIIRGKPSTDTYCGPCSRALMEALGIDPADFDAAKMLLVGPAATADKSWGDRRRSLS